MYKRDIEKLTNNRDTFIIKGQIVKLRYCPSVVDSCELCYFKSSNCDIVDEEDDDFSLICRYASRGSDNYYFIKAKSPISLIYVSYWRTHETFR